MIRVILVIPFLVLHCFLAQARTPLFTDCSAPEFQARRGNLVCEGGAIQLEQVYDYNLLDSRLAIRERVESLGIPAILVNVEYPLHGCSVKNWTPGANPDGLSPALLEKATGLVIIPQEAGCSLPLGLDCHGTIFGRDNVPSQPENFQGELVAAKSTKTRQVHRNHIPWYFFWLKRQINTFDSGDFDHVTCAFPSLYFAREAFNANRKYCPYFRSESPEPLAAGPRRVPTFLLFDKDVNLSAFANPISRIDMVALNDEVVSTWEGENPKDEGLTIQRGNIQSGLYGLIIQDEAGGVIYSGIIVQGPEPAVSDLYDPISPNPMREEAMLDLSLLEEPVLKIAVYDKEGQLHKRLQTSMDARAVPIPRDDLDAGEYLVEVRNTRQSGFLALRGLQQTPGSLQINPNPAGDFTWLELAEIEGEVLSIQRFSAEGRLIRKYDAPTIRADHYPLNTNDLPARVYFVEVITPKKNAFGMVILKRAKRQMGIPRNLGKPMWRAKTGERPKPIIY